MPKSTKVTSPEISKIAARGLSKPESLTLAEIRKVCASALAQDETKGD